MITFIQQRMRWILTIILVLLGLSFLFFSNVLPSGRPQIANSNAPLGRVRGEKFTTADFQRLVDSSAIMFSFQTGLNLQSFPRMREFVVQNAFEQLIALPAARAAGIIITDQEIVEFLKKNSRFLDREGQYDHNRFRAEFLNPLQLSPREFYQIVREHLMFTRIKNMIEGTALIDPASLEAQFRLEYGPVVVGYVRLPVDAVRREIKPQEDDLKQFYTAMQAQYSTPERRVIEFIHFRVEGLQSMEADARALALNERRQDAHRLVDELEAGGMTVTATAFARAAEQRGLTVIESKPFTSDDVIADGLENPELAPAAFSLTPRRPLGPVVDTPEGAVVFRLKRVIPSEPLSFEEARPRVLEDYLRSRAASLLREQAAKVTEALRKALDSGKDWVAAAKTVKLKPTVLAPFSPRGLDLRGMENPDPVLIRAPQVVVSMKPGELSDPINVDGDLVILALISREDPSEELRQQFLPSLSQRMLSARRQEIYAEWFEAERQRPDTSLDKLLESARRPEKS